VIGGGIEGFFNPAAGMSRAETSRAQLSGGATASVPGAILAALLSRRMGVRRMKNLGRTALLGAGAGTWLGSTTARGLNEKNVLPNYSFKNASYKERWVAERMSQIFGLDC
jgi:hypothetical protein